MKIISSLKTFVLVFTLFNFTTQIGQCAWLKTYSPTLGIASVERHRSKGGSFYLSGVKFDKQFSVKLGGDGQFKWGKLLISPIHIDHNPLNQLPPFSYMFTNKVDTPFIWGKTVQNNENGLLKQVYTKTFANQPDGIFQLTSLNEGQTKAKEYLINGLVNSSIRHGSNTLLGDMALAKLNLASGQLDWNHIYGFDIPSFTLVTNVNFPHITKSLDNYVFSRSMQFANPSSLNNASIYTVLAKLSARDGSLIGVPVMIDGVEGTHATLLDGSVIFYSYFGNVIIKLDNNLNVIWSKSLNDPLFNFPGVPFGLSPTVGHELADGNFELSGMRVLPPGRFISRVVIHISTADGHIVVTKEKGWSNFENSLVNINTFTYDNNTPSGFDWFSGYTTDNGISYGKFDESISPIWVKKLTRNAGAIKVENLSDGVIKIQPHNFATTYSLTAFGHQKMLFGLLNAKGEIPGCSAIKNTKLDLTTGSIVATDINPSIVHPTSVVVDFGPLPTTVVDYNMPKIRTKDMKWNETSICK
jgi:hypothetical protein